MSKKHKKQRAKTQKAQPQVRRQSGITLRAVSPPVALAKVIELKKPDAPKAPAPAGPTAAESPASPEPASTSAVGGAAQELTSEALAPAAPAIADEAPRTAPGSTTEEDARPAETPPEHRSSRRVSVAVHIHWWSDSHFYSDLSGDISEGGLFLSTYRPLTVGSAVDVEFTLPGTERSIRARGEVRWVREHSAELPRGVGIAFEKMPEDDRDEIHAFCTTRPPLYYEDVG